MRLSRLLVLPTVAAALAVPEAAAAGTGSLSSGSGVLFKDCYHHGWSANVDADETDWRLDVTVTDPQGSIFTTEEEVGGTDQPIALEGLWMFCGDEPAGVYTIVGTLTEYLPSGDVASTTQLADSTFRMRQPRTRTTLAVSDTTPHFNEIVRLTATTMDERPHRYARRPLASTKLQYKTSSGWVDLRRSGRTTNHRGLSVWKYRWNVTTTLRIRAVTLRRAYYSGSTSRGKTINQTPGGRVVARPASRPGVASVD